MILLRFADLKARGIVRNWPTLARWIHDQGFPQGKLIGPNTRVWTEDEIAAWLDNRPSRKKGAA
jgi:predicted DNA-binding transcriptional regulator AlpA